MDDALRALAARVPYDRGPTILELFEVGEEHLALDILLDNLREFEIPLTPAERAWLAEACRVYCVEERLLDGLVVEGAVRLDGAIDRVRPHARPEWLSACCDGTVTLTVDRVVVFRDGPEFLLVELAVELGRWLAGGGSDFAYTTMDDEEGPTMAWTCADGVCTFRSAYDHMPCTFDLDEMRAAARAFLRDLDRDLRARGYAAPTPPE